MDFKEYQQLSELVEEDFIEFYKKFRQLNKITQKEQIETILSKVKNDITKKDNNNYLRLVKFALNGLIEFSNLALSGKQSLRHQIYLLLKEECV